MIFLQVEKKKFLTVTLLVTGTIAIQIPLNHELIVINKNIKEAIISPYDLGVTKEFLNQHTMLV